MISLSETNKCKGHEKDSTCSSLLVDVGKFNGGEGANKRDVSKSWR